MTKDNYEVTPSTGKNDGKVSVVMPATPKFINSYLKFTGGG